MGNNNTKILELGLGLCNEAPEVSNQIDFGDLELQASNEQMTNSSINENTVRNQYGPIYNDNFHQQSKIDATPVFDNLGDFNFEDELKIKIFGIGGAGNNMIKHIANSTNINKKWLYAINTDYQVLKMMPNGINLVLIGRKITKGLGSGSDPEIGRDAALEDVEIIKQQLRDTDLLFIVSGMGKGTGTGASPVIAEIAKEMGILTISLVNLPSISNEGKMIYEKGYNGLNVLREHAAGLLTISNEKLFKDTAGDLTIWESFLYANQIIGDVISDMIDLVTIPSEINVDFNDMKNFFNKQTEFQVNSFTFNNENEITEKINEKLNNEIFQDSLNGASKIIINYKLNPKVTNQFINNVRSALEEITGNRDLEVTYAVGYDVSIEYASLSIIVATNNISDKSEYIKQDELDPTDRILSDLSLKSNHVKKMEDLISPNRKNPFEDNEEFIDFQSALESTSRELDKEEDNESLSPTKLNKMIHKTLQFTGTINKKR
ncbi:MAG: cell division protein FtsZ [Mycoplasma sp.]